MLDTYYIMTYYAPYVYSVQHTRMITHQKSLLFLHMMPSEVISFLKMQLIKIDSDC